MFPRTRGLGQGDFIRTRIYHEYLGSIKIATRLDHISLCKTACVKQRVEQIGRIDGPTDYLT